MALVAYMAFGSCLILVALSWKPLWWVERPTSRVAAMDLGSFWEFLDNLPGAVENLSIPQTPEVILTILPTVYLWQNVRTTLFILAIGAVLGLVLWWGIEYVRFSIRREKN
jgi:hypothetical protein